jgi:hypothetical protein
MEALRQPAEAPHGEYLEALIREELREGLAAVYRGVQKLDLAA